MRKSKLITREMVDQIQQKRAESLAQPHSELARKAA